MISAAVGSMDRPDGGVPCPPVGVALGVVGVTSDDAVVVAAIVVAVVFTVFTALLPAAYRIAHAPIDRRASTPTIMPIIRPTLLRGLGGGGCMPPYMPGCPYPRCCGGATY